MKFYVKEKLLAIGAKFIVYNNLDQAQYIVEADKFDIGKNISLYTIDKSRKLLYLKQKIRLGSHKYVMYSETGSELATIEKVPLSPNYNLDSIYGAMELNGDFLRRHFKLISNGKTIGSIDKELSFRDAYYIDVIREDLELFIIGLGIMIDMVSFHKNN